jgi:hypothetical protein
MTDEATRDELAGVVDLFGALTRAELERALSELAFKRGREADRAALSAAVDDAVASYHLVPFERDGETHLAVGPVAFPTLPDGAEDLPHIMDVGRRDVDREALAERAERRLRSDAARAVADGDADRMERLLDVCYDLDAWGPVDLDPVRERLDDALSASDGHN